MSLPSSSLKELPTLQELQAEFWKRRTARQSLTEWARYKGFSPAKHHRLIIDEIEAFLASDDEVLLLFAPPGSAKSTYVSHLFPPWYLAKYPGRSILAATHSVEFAQRWGRRCRNDVALDGHILGIALAGDSTAADRWALTSGGEYYGVGAGVGIAGFRADLGLGDDFFGSREDAYSETVRKKRWDWYRDDFSARLKPGAKRILMNTRWHEEDVAGLVLEQVQSGLVKGRVVSLPAIAGSDDVLGREPGEFLWDDDPAYDYPAFLRARQRETSPMMWSALYQQRPAPEEGSFFKHQWFKRFNGSTKPKDLHLYGTSDYAVTEDGGDWSVHRVWAVDSLGELYCLGGWRGQTTSDVWIERQIDLIAEHRPFCWFGEGGVIAKAIEPMLRRRMVERKTMCRLEWLPSINDKPTRARGFQARAAMGKVHVIEGPEGDAIIDEYIRFPAGKHDDEVDCGSLIGRALDEVHPAIVKRKHHDPNPSDLHKWRRGENETGWQAY